MHAALKLLFEEQVSFRLQDGTSLDGGVYIGETEFLPVETLKDDPDAYRNEFERWRNDVWFHDMSSVRELTLNLPRNRDRFSDLQQAVKRCQVIPLVGSGMSASSGLPTWADFLRRLRGNTNITKKTLEDLIRKSEFENAADLIILSVNNRFIDERVEHDLRIDSVNIIYGPIRLLPIIFSNLVITTNLDNLLEKHYQECSMSFDHVLAGHEVGQYRGLKNNHSNFLLKLHGDCRRSETRVLTTKEYDSAYAPGSPTREELELLYRSNSILFLGSSLGPDRTVDLFKEVANRDSNMPRHYAFLPLPKSNRQCHERERFLTERGIFPIWYSGQHDESIGALLAGLIDATE